MAEISINLPDRLVEQLQASGHRNVSAFVANLIRDELDRERLIAFLDELDEEFGPTDETEIAECSAAFMRTAAITRGGLVATGDPGDLRALARHHPNVDVRAL